MMDMRIKTMTQITESPQSLQQYIKWLQNAVEKSHLYDNEEYAKIKKELYQAKKLRTLIQSRRKSAYGFGYKFEPLASPPSVSDASSGTDDGVHSEGEQPTEPGQS